MVRFGMVPNGAWLQGRYKTNKDKQQQVRITNAEWDNYGFLGPISEVRRIVPNEAVRAFENKTRLDRAHGLKRLADAIMEMEKRDEDPIR